MIEREAPSSRRRVRSAIARRASDRHGPPAQLDPAGRPRPARWITPDQRRTSAAVAPGSATMKFACFVETRWRRRPASPCSPAASIRRGGVVARRVREHAAAVRLGDRLRRAAPAPGLVHRARGSRRVAPDAARRCAPITTASVAEVGAPVREPDLGRGDGSVPPSRRSEHLDRLDHVGHLRAVRARVHPHGPAEARRDRHAERQPREPMLQRDAGERRQRHRAAGRAVSPSRAAHRYPRPSRSTSPGNPSSATRTLEPLPKTTNGMSVARDRVGRRGEVAARPPAPGTARPARRSGTSSAAPSGIQSATRSPHAVAQDRVGAARGRRVTRPASAIRSQRGVTQHPDVPAAHRDDEVAGARPPGPGTSRRRRGAAGTRCASRARPARRRRPPARPVTPGIGVLRGAVDVGDHDQIGLRDARAELAPQRLHARVPVRLDERDQPCADPLRRAVCDRHRHLRRRVPVVVEELAPRAPPAELEPAVHAGRTPPAPRRRPRRATPARAATPSAAAAFSRLCGAVDAQAQRYLGTRRHRDAPARPLGTEGLDHEAQRPRRRLDAVGHRVDARPRRARRHAGVVAAGDHVLARSRRTPRTRPRSPRRPPG